jgi:hypothetical protein
VTGVVCFMMLVPYCRRNIGAIGGSFDNGLSDAPLLVVIRLPRVALRLKRKGCVMLVRSILAMLIAALLAPAAGAGLVILAYSF